MQELAGALIRIDSVLRKTGETKEIEIPTSDGEDQLAEVALFSSGADSGNPEQQLARNKTDNLQREQVLPDPAPQKAIPVSETSAIEKAESDTAAELQFVCFRVANEQYGVDIQRVREITHTDGLTVPGDGPDYIAGECDWRGVKVSVVDLCRRLGHPPVEYDLRSRILILERGTETHGLLVEDLVGVIRITQNAISPPDDATASAGSQYLTGVFHHDDEQIMLLNIDAIVQL